MEHWLTWLAALAMLPATVLFARAGYRVRRGDIVVRNGDGSIKTPLRYALWTSFCGGFAAFLLWQALTGR